MSKSLLTLLLGLALAVPAALPSPTSAQAACPTPSPTPELTPDAPLLMPEDARLGLFDALWGTIDQGYLDPDFNGVDWAAIGDEYAPYFLQTENAWEVYDLAKEMIALLGDDEVRFIDPLFIESLPPVETGYAGIGTLLDTGANGDSSSPRILYIFPGSGAEAAGLMPRDRLVSVDGDPCISIAAVRGPVGTTVTLGIESPGEPVRDVVVERRQIDPLFLPIASRMGVDGSIGYLRLPSVAGQPMVDGITEALGGFAGDDPITGLVLDLRSTNQGAPGVTVSLLGHLLDGDAGTLYSRTDESALELVDSDLRATLSRVPIAVLVDADSAGEPERIALILQATGRAQVVGAATPGRTRGITEVPFPDGSVLQLVTVGLELPDGTRPGRAGVTPDVPLEGDWLAYAEADDPWLLKALDLLQSDAG